MNYKEKIDALIEKQKELLIPLVPIMDGVSSKDELIDELETPGTTRHKRVETFSDIPMNIIKNIMNSRDDYPYYHFEVFEQEMSDNANDVDAAHRYVTLAKKDMETIISFLDDGPGIDNLLRFLELSGAGKSRESKTMGLAGEGAKLVVPYAVYIYTETKRPDGATEAVIWFVNYRKEKVKFIPVKPQGKVTTPTGTITEIHFFNPLMDFIPNEEDIVATLQHFYRTDLLQNPGSVEVNEQLVVAEDFPSGKTLDFSFCEGQMIVADRELAPEDAGIILNIHRKDVMVLRLHNDFGIDVRPDVENRITGYIRYDKFKEIIAVNKSDIHKRKTGKSHIWNTFRSKIKAEIVKFLKDNGLLIEHQIRSNKRAYEEVNKDLKYLLKKNPTAKKLFKTLKVPSGNKGTKHHTPQRSMPAMEEKREGDGSVEGIIIFSEASEKKGCSAATDTDDFFDMDNVAPIEETAEVTLNVYKKIPGRRRLIRLVTEASKNITATGATFSIDNLPLDVPLIVKAQTTYGIAHNEILPLGRPIGHILLTETQPTQRIVLPIRKIQGDINVRDDALHGDDIAVLQDMQDETGQEIVFDTTHPEFKLSVKEEQEYIHRLRGVIHAVCSQVDDEDERKRTYTDLLRTVVRRH